MAGWREPTGTVVFRATRATQARYREIRFAASQCHGTDTAVAQDDSTANPRWSRINATTAASCGVLEIPDRVLLLYASNTDCPSGLKIACACRQTACLPPAPCCCRIAPVSATGLGTSRSQENSGHTPTCGAVQLLCRMHMVHSCSGVCALITHKHVLCWQPHSGSPCCTVISS